MKASNIKFIHCRLCAKDVHINKNGAVRAHKDQSNKHCANSGVNWELVANSLNAHISVGSVVKFELVTKEVRAVVKSHSESGTAILTEEDQELIIRTIPLSVIEVSSDEKRAWSMSANIVRPSLTSAEIDTLHTERSWGLIDKKGDIWVRGENGEVTKEASLLAPAVDGSRAIVVHSGGMGTLSVMMCLTRALDVNESAPAPLPKHDILREVLEPTAHLKSAELIALNNIALEEMSASPMMSDISLDTRVTLTEKGRRALIELADTEDRLMSALRHDPSREVVIEALELANNCSPAGVMQNERGAFVDYRRLAYHSTAWLYVDYGRISEGQRGEQYERHWEDLAPTSNDYSVQKVKECFGAWSLADSNVVHGTGDTVNDAIHNADLNMINDYYATQNKSKPYLGVDLCHVIFALNEEGELEVAVIPLFITDDRSEALEIADLPEAVAVTTCLHIVETYNGHYMGYAYAECAASALMDKIHAESIAH